MRTFFLKILILAILATFLNSCFLFRSEAADLDELQQEIEKLEGEVERLEGKSKIYQQNINEKKKEINSLNNKISIYDNRIKKLENDIYLTAQEIKLKNLLIQGIEIEIDKTFLSIDEKKKVLAGMIQIINDYDKRGLVEVLFEGDKLSEFFDQARYIDSVHKGLSDSLNEVKDLKQVLESKKRTSQREKSQLEELRQRTNVQKYALDQERGSQENLLTQTKGEESRYQQLLSITQQEQAKLIKEMVGLEKEAERLKNFIYYSEIGKIPPAGTKIFRWPEDDPILTQRYGMTDFAKSGAYGGAGHNGIDMSSGLGSPIRAAADGEILAKSYNSGWGNWITVKHDNGMVTLYAHMIKESFRKTGERVDAGDVIGYEGSTGFSTGSHLHFSVYHKFFTYNRNGQIYFNYFDGTLNPLNYL